MAATGAADASRLAGLVAAAAFLPTPVFGGEVCTTYLEEHLIDAAWQKECVAELESLAATGFGGQALTLGGSVNLGPQGLVNVSRPCPPGATPEGCPDDQNEVFIAADPGDPSRLFAISKSAPFGSLFTARCCDPDGDWIPAFIADGTGPLPAGGGDPWAVFDGFGNLYVSYLGLVTA